MDASKEDHKSKASSRESHWQATWEASALQYEARVCETGVCTESVQKRASKTLVPAEGMLPAECCFHQNVPTCKKNSCTAVLPLWADVLPHAPEHASHWRAAWKASAAQCEARVCEQGVYTESVQKSALKARLWCQQKICCQTNAVPTRSCPNV